MIAKVKLTKKQPVAAGTMAFHFEKPAGFSYRPGQFADFTLLNPPETDQEGNVRGFSLASAPSDDDIFIVTRLRDTAFKRVLAKAPLGTEVELDGPYGDFTLHKTQNTPAVFLTGGIGMTPVHSIVAQATRDQLPQHITMLYSNRTPADAAYLQEFEGLAKSNNYFTFVPVMTKAPTSWAGERGYIDAAMLKRHINNLTKPIYYLSGPAAMVAAMRHMLVEAGVNEDNIRTEEFTGYSSEVAVQASV